MAEGRCSPGVDGVRGNSTSQRTQGGTMSDPELDPEHAFDPTGPLETADGLRALLSAEVVLGEVEHDLFRDRVNQLWEQQRAVRRRLADEIERFGTRDSQAGEAQIAESATKLWEALDECERLAVDVDEALQGFQQTADLRASALTDLLDRLHIAEARNLD
ncbi:hypothetical protein J4573_27550 [Actinomadura barringtoniae]|uniref:Uncharacterized protein n=1 Tax=Actinomadura barringtoniae TaxID=1427535 RepID=A0A939TC51_9ACTN|nr:hypothetical protein [Actinomadura barringtoniae]MBO2450880.1 hypothetical protein [Actinomadura barringtoniae]